MDQLRIKIGGFGGQGIILSSYIIGKAATIYDNLHASMTQSYGPEARGGACSSSVVIEDKIVSYPLCDEADVLVVLSQEAYDNYHKILKPGGILIYDEDLVKNLKDKDKVKLYPIPATRLAEELGKKIVANIIALGYLTQICKTPSYEAMKQAVKESVPERFIDINLKAFDEGYNYKKGVFK